MGYFSKGGTGHCTHYIIWGALLSKDCAESLRILLEVCLEFGIPVATQKCQGPTTRLVFLGIEFDSMSMELKLPKEKLAGHHHQLEKEEELSAKGTGVPGGALA